MHESGTAVSESVSEVYSAATEHLQNLKAMKFYDAQTSDLAMFTSLQSSALQQSLTNTRSQAAAAFWFEAGSLAVLGAIIFASLQILNVAPASILLLLAIFTRLIPRLAAGQSQLQAFLSELPAFENLMTIYRGCVANAEAVSYTHLDVYKRQVLAGGPAGDCLVSAGLVGAVAVPVGRHRRARSVGAGCRPDLAAGTFTPRYLGCNDPSKMGDGKQPNSLLSCPLALPTTDPSTSPRFPVKLRGVSDLHAAFFKESRIRGRWWRRVVGNPGFGRDDKGGRRFGPSRLPVERTADPSTAVGTTKGCLLYTSRCV